MSLRWRIAAALAIVAALVSTFGAAAAYFSTASRLEHSVDETMLATVGGLSRATPERRPGGGSQDAFTRPTGCPPAGVFQPAHAAQLVEDDGSVVACIEGGAVLPVDALDRRIAAAGTGQRLRTVSIDGTSYRVLTIASGAGTFQVARSLAEVDSVLASLRLRLALIGFVGVAVAALLGWLLARRLLHPVDRLRATAEHIAHTQDLATPVPQAGTAEIGSLAESFTTMVDALARSRREQQQLISDASHELRTPLTSLRTNAELLARAPGLDAAEQREVVEGIQSEVLELTDLVTELVELATDRAADEHPEPVVLADLAEQVAARARRRTGRDVVVVREPGAQTIPDAAVLARPQMLERAVSNLVENALKYSPSTGRVVVAVGDTSLEVRDEGSGIASEDQPHVFDRFYRAVAARTAPGSGLGLAIVKQTIERHGGRVWADTRPEGGAAVGFALPPLAPDAAPRPGDD